MICAKAAEPIKMLFGVWTRLTVGPKQHVLDEGAHWRQLTNTIEPSMRGGDAAFLSNYLCPLVTNTNSQLTQVITQYGNLKTTKVEVNAETLPTKISSRIVGYISNFIGLKLNKPSE